MNLSLAADLPRDVIQHIKQEASLELGMEGHYHYANLCLDPREPQFWHIGLECSP